MSTSDDSAEPEDTPGRGADRYRGKVAFITGAGAGIGRATAPSGSWRGQKW